MAKVGNSFNEEVEEEDHMKPDKIIDQVDNEAKIKKIVDYGEDNQEAEQKRLEQAQSQMKQNENIILAFSLDPYQLIVI